MMNVLLACRQLGVAIAALSFHGDKGESNKFLYEVVSLLARLRASTRHERARRAQLPEETCEPQWRQGSGPRDREQEADRAWREACSSGKEEEAALRCAAPGRG
jgi:hypothetical protein